MESETPLPGNAFATRTQVMFYDTDCGGVVHNLAYLRWIEECRTKLATHEGIDYAAMASEGLYTVLVRHEIDYVFPAMLADEIETRGCIDEVEKASLWFRFEVRRVRDGRLCVKARQRLALVSMPSGRPQRIPSAWRGKSARSMPNQ